MPDFWEPVAQAISRATGSPFSVEVERPVTGGDSNRAFRVQDRQGRSFFVKINRAERVEMFVAESEGLRELAQARTVRVPAPVCVGTNQGYAYLVMEYLRLGAASERRMEDLGSRLARLHRVSRDSFGWHMDNTLGETPQPNPPSSDWVAFWQEHRLGHQLRLAAVNGLPGALQDAGERLAADLPRFFSRYQPRPSLLHGDLWHGNKGFLTTGEPVLFDPAVYFGDREADLAMTELFGLFPAGFYAAYEAVWPLDDGYAARRALYQSYQLLNHANLFGGPYVDQAQRALGAALCELV